MYVLIYMYTHVPQFGGMHNLAHKTYVCYTMYFGYLIGNALYSYVITKFSSFSYNANFVQCIKQLMSVLHMYMYFKEHGWG